MSFEPITLKTNIQPIKIYIDELLKIDCLLVPYVLSKKNGNFHDYTFRGFINNKETDTHLITINPTERKIIYDDVNIYNIKTEIKRNKTKFIMDDKIIELLEEIQIECKNILRNKKTLKELSILI